MRKIGKLNVKDKVILGICAHPDDLDFGSSGTVAKFVKEGAKVYYLLLTDGSKGSENLGITPKQLVKIRVEEQKAAGKVLGLTDVFFLNAVDGELANTPEIRKQVVRIIRTLKPDIVITLDPSFYYDETTGFINHPDHRMAGQIALDCVFPFARNAKTFPELIDDEGLHSFSVKQLLIANSAKANKGEANLYVDITNTLKLKLEALRQHVSQFDDFSLIEERMTARAAALGKKVGVKYAEGFILLNIP